MTPNDAVLMLTQYTQTAAKILDQKTQSIQTARNFRVVDQKTQSIQTARTQMCVGSVQTEEMMALDAVVQTEDHEKNIMISEETSVCNRIVMIMIQIGFVFMVYVMLMQLMHFDIRISMPSMQMEFEISV